jgi:2,3-bisphosphoglycerate-independent phosphoglycerate mutase
MTAAARPRPLVLAILDGLGERAERDANAVRLARTPTLDALAGYPRTILAASGADVGLPAGRPGDGEAGHRALGAGRVALMDRARIDELVALRRLAENEVIHDTIRIAKHHHAGRLHLIGLLSDTGEHASTSHLFGLIEAAHDEEVPVVVHAILDGRDAKSGNAGELIAQIEHVLDGGKKGVIGTLAGRSFAMDTDGRWDRVLLAHRAIVRGPAPRAETALEALRAAHDSNKTDAQIEPVRIGEYTGIKGDFMCDFAVADPIWCWYGEENAFVWNLRADGLADLAAMLQRKNLPREVEAEMLTERGKPIFGLDKDSLASLTEIDPALGLRVAFPREPLADTLGEVLAKAGLTQLRCAETLKRAHVTSYWNGGREAPFDGEERALVPSPRDLPSHDRKPEMSAPAVAARVVEAIQAGKHDFILVNLGNADVVAQTGKLEATLQAVEAMDAALATIAAAVRDAGGVLVVTSDHGNCERMRDANGRPLGAATTSPVPLWYVSDRDREAKLRDGGRLADVAPTLIELLGLPQPAAMTGRSLLVR